MSINLPSGLDWVIEIAAGQAFPKGDEDKVSRMGDAFYLTRDQLNGFSEQLGASGDKVLEGVSGPTAKQFNDFLGNFRTNVPQLAQGAGQLGDTSKDFALQTEYAKYMIILQLIWMAEQIAEWASTIFGAALVPEIEAAGRFAVQSILKTFAKQVAKSVAESVAANAFMDAAVQGIQFLKGDRKHWDTKSTISGIEMGAVAGALGSVLHIGAAKIAPDLVNSFVGHVGMGAINGVVVGEVTNLAFGSDQNLGLAAASGAFGGVMGHRPEKPGDNVHIDPLDLRPMEGMDGHPGEIPPTYQEAAADKPPTYQPYADKAPAYASPAHEPAAVNPNPERRGYTGLPGFDSVVSEPRAQGNGVAADESWRHSEATTADWFAPAAKPLRADQWEPVRQNADVRRVQTEEADVRTTSRIIPATAAGGRPRIVIDRTDGLVRYDVRRIEAAPNEFVREFTVRLNLDAHESVSPEQVTALQERAQQGVDSMLNKGYRLPGGDQFHVRLEFEGDGAPNALPAHANVKVVSDAEGMTQDRWSVKAPPAVIAHEVLHYLGVHDENFDAGRVFLNHEPGSGIGAVHNDNGMMGDAVHSTESAPEFLPRHAWAVERVSDSQVTVTPSRYGEHGAARPATLPDIKDRWDIGRDEAIPTRPMPGSSDGEHEEHEDPPVPAPAQLVTAPSEDDPVPLPHAETVEHLAEAETVVWGEGLPEPPIEGQAAHPPRDLVAELGQDEREGWQDEQARQEQERLQEAAQREAAEAEQRKAQELKEQQEREARELQQQEREEAERQREQEAARKAQLLKEQQEREEAERQREQEAARKAQLLKEQQEREARELQQQREREEAERQREQEAARKAQLLKEQQEREEREAKERREQEAADRQRKEDDARREREARERQEREAKERREKEEAERQRKDDEARRAREEERRRAAEEATRKAEQERREREAADRKAQQDRQRKQDAIIRARQEGARRLTESRRQRRAARTDPPTLVDLHDDRDEGRIFAPAVYASSDGHQAIGPETIEFANGDVLDAIRNRVLDQFDHDMHPAVRAWFNEHFTADRLEGDIQQAVGDQLELTMPTPDGPHTIIVRIRLGDWIQATDPRGERVVWDRDVALGSTGQHRARTRQVIDYSTTADVSRGVAGGFDVAYTPSGTHGEGDHLFNGAGGSGTVKGAPSRNTAATGVSTSGGTTRYAKGSSYRAVDFVFDAGVEVFVRRAGENQLRYGHSVVDEGLIARYSRENTRSMDSTDPYGTSQRWGEPGATANLRSEHTRLAGATQADRRAQLLPDYTVNAPDVVDNKRVEVPRISVPVAMNRTGEVRSMVVQTAKEGVRHDGTDSHDALTGFTDVQTLLGSIMDAGHGAVRTPTLHGTKVIRPDVRDAVSLDVSFHDPVIVSEHDPFTRLDSEDVFTRVGRAPHTQSDALDLAGAANFALKRTIGWTPNLPLSLVRSVDQNRPGHGYGHIELHKLKFTDEPTVLVRFTARVGARSDADRNTRNETTAHVWMRVLVSDVKKADWNNFDPSAGPHGLDHSIQPQHEDEQAKLDEYEARTGSGRELRLPDLFEQWLPPNSRISRWEDGADGVLNSAVDVIARQFPDYLGLPSHSEKAKYFVPGGPAARLVGDNTARRIGRFFEDTATRPSGAGAVPSKERLKGFDNFLTLIDQLTPEGMARNIHVMANGGLRISLVKPGDVHGNRIVLTIKAQYKPKTFDYERTLGGQMEVYYGDFFDLSGSTKRATSASSGMDASFAIGQASTKSLQEMDVRPGYRVNFSKGATESSGYSAGGAVGGGSNWLSEFSGDFEFDVTAHEESPLPDQAPPPLTLGALESGTGHGALDDGTSRRFAAPRTTVRGHLLTSEDIVQERDTDGTWRSTLDFRTESGLGGMHTPRRVADAIAAPRPKWTPPPRQSKAPQDPGRTAGPPTARALAKAREAATTASAGRGMPQNALFMGDARRLHDDVVARFRDLGLDHVPAEDLASIDQALTGAGPRLRDFMVPGGRPVWTGRIDHGWTLNPANLADRMYEVRLEVDPDEHTALGDPSDHAYTYLHSLGGASVSRAVEHDDGSFSYSLSVNFPSKLLEHQGGQEVAGPHALNPAGTVSRGTSDPVNESRSTGGQFDRVAINVGKQVWAEGSVNARVTVRTWHKAVGASFWEHDAHSPADTKLPTLALIPHAQAHELGLAPAPGHVDDGAAPANTLLPPTNVARGDGIGHAMIGDVPDLTGLYDRVMRTARDNLSQAQADAVQAEVAKATTLIASKATLEQSLTGYSLLVPVRDKGVINSYVRVDFRARLGKPVHVGPSDAPFVLERKNVRTVTEQKGHASNTSWTYGGGLTKTYDTSARDVVREHNGGLSASYSRRDGHAYGNTDGTEESLGMLNLPGLNGEKRAAAFEFDVDYDVTIRTSTTLTSTLNTMTLDMIGWDGEHRVPTYHTARSLQLSYPEAITRPDDGTGTAPPARTAPHITNMPLLEGAAVPASPRWRDVTQEDLREVDVETVGGLAEIRRQAQGMFTAPHWLTGREAKSWQTGLQRLQHRIETVTTSPYMDRWFLHMLTGDGEPLPLTEPGVVYDSLGELHLLPKITEWRVMKAPEDPTAGGPSAPAQDMRLPNTIVKNFQRTVAQQNSSHSASRGISLTGSANVRESSNVKDVPDPTAPGALDTSTHNIALTASGRVDTGTGSGGQRSMRETGDKTTGRDYTRIEVQGVEWTLLWKPKNGEQMMRRFEIRDEAAVLWAPTEHLGRLRAHGLDQPPSKPVTRPKPAVVKQTKPPVFPAVPKDRPGPHLKPDASAAAETVKLAERPISMAKPQPLALKAPEQPAEDFAPSVVKAPPHPFAVQDPEHSPETASKPLPLPTLISAPPEASAVKDPPAAFMPPTEHLAGPPTPLQPPIQAHRPLQAMQQGYVAHRVQSYDGLSGRSQHSGRSEQQIRDQLSRAPAPPSSLDPRPQRLDAPTTLGGTAPHETAAPSAQHQWFAVPEREGGGTGATQFRFTPGGEVYVNTGHDLPATGWHRVGDRFVNPRTIMTVHANGQVSPLSGQEEAIPADAGPYRLSFDDTLILGLNFTGGDRPAHIGLVSVQPPEAQPVLHLPDVPVLEVPIPDTPVLETPAPAAPTDDAAPHTPQRVPEAS
jgi:hypothetical protein